MFDTKFYLENKEDRNIFESGTKGLPNGLQLVGDKEIFNDFRQIIGDRIKNVRMMEVFKVVIKWEGGAVIENTETTQNIINKRGLESGNIVRQVDLVWENTGFGGVDKKTPKYF